MTGLGTPFSYLMRLIFFLSFASSAVQAEPFQDPHAAMDRVVVEKAKISSRSLLQLSQWHQFDLSPYGESRQESGSVFCWDDQGLRVTAEHVIGASRSVALGSGVELSVEKRIVDWDVALLKGPPCHSIDRRFSPMTIGEQVTLIGYAPSQGWRTIQGEVLEAERPRSIGHGWSPPLVGIAAPVGPGFSGGMVLDSQGLLVGMIQAAEPGKVAYALSTQRIVAAIDNQRGVLGIAMASGKIKSLKDRTSQGLPIEMLSVSRFGREWVDPRPAFMGLMLGERLSIQTSVESIELSTDTASQSSLSLSRVDDGWLVVEPGSSLSEMGLLSGDVITRVSGALVKGEPPELLQGMLEIHRDGILYHLVAP